MIGKQVLSTSAIYDFTHVRKLHSQAKRHSVRRILLVECEQIGRAETRGRPWLWRLKSNGGSAPSD